MNTQIVHVAKGHVFTDTLVISEQCELEHASVIKLVRKYKSDFEELGRVGFETRPFISAQVQAFACRCGNREKTSRKVITF